MGSIWAISIFVQSLLGLENFDLILTLILISNDIIQFWEAEEGGKATQSFNNRLLYPFLIPDVLVNKTGWTLKI